MQRNCLATGASGTAFQLLSAVRCVPRTRGESRKSPTTGFYLELWRSGDSGRTGYGRRYERARPPPLQVKVIRVRFATQLSGRCIIYWLIILPHPPIEIIDHRTLIGKMDMSSSAEAAIFKYVMYPTKLCALNIYRISVQHFLVARL